MTDVWGAIQIPMPLGQPGQPPGDPCLFYIVDFLKTYLSTDKNATAQWNIAGVAPYLDPVVKTFVASPDDKTYPFSSANLPALFIYRQGGTFDSWGDDWDINHDVVKLVWVFPTARPENTRTQLPFANALVKCIYNGIELGRTPSWQQPNDPDPFATKQGSLMYTYAAFVHFTAKSWRTTFIQVDDVAGKRVGNFPAIDLTYELIENRVIGTDDPNRYAPNLGMTDTISVATFVPFQSWAASTLYAARALVVPTVSNGSFYTCSSPGTSGTSQPVFPTTPGFTVNDGSLVWTCVGPTSYARWAALTPYALSAFVIPPTPNGFYYQATTPGRTGASPPVFPVIVGNTVTDGTVVWTCAATTSRVVDSGPLETIAPGPL